MAEKQTAGKQTPTRLSLASRMLGATLRGKLAEAPMDESWRNNNAKRQSKTKRPK